VESLRIPAAEERAHRPQHDFWARGGTFRDGNGDVIGYGVKKASRITGIPSDRLYDWIKKLPRPYRHLFPGHDGLPIQWLPVPGTTNRLEMAIAPKDLDVLTAAVTSFLREGPSLANFQTSEEICESNTTTDIGDRIRVRALLRELADAGTLRSAVRPSKRKGHNGEWSYPQAFDPAEIGRYLGDRNLVDVAREFSRDVNGAQAGFDGGAAAVPQDGEQGRRKERRSAGRRPLPATQELHRFCYEARMHGIKRKLVMAFANGYFKRRVIKNDKHVTTYAQRYAADKKKQFNPPAELCPEPFVFLPADPGKEPFCYHRPGGATK
jgi:hypothetical protein